MTTSVKHLSKIGRLARLIESDIRRRGIASGEPYLTANEVGLKLGVHPRTAGRAMKLLASRKILLSKPGVGTFVGPEIAESTSSPLRAVHLILSAEGLCDIPLQELVAAIIEQIPNCDVQLNFLPQDDPLGYLRRVFLDKKNEKAVLGVVLVSCPRPVQEVVVNFRLPTVVLGSNYPTTQELASIDVDQFEAGHLLANFLCQRDQHKLAFITHELWLPGDNQFFDGVRAALDEAGLGHGALVLRSISTDASVVDAEIKSLLSAVEPPTGLICRSQFFAAAALRVAEELSLKVPENLEIVYDGTIGLLSLPGKSLPFVQSDLDQKSLCKTLGQMLGQLIDGKPAEPSCVASSVRLVNPAENAQQVERASGGSVSGE